MLCVMSMRGGKGKLLVIQFLDVSQTHPHCDVLGDHVCHLERELWLLVKLSTYAVRGAGPAFEFASWGNKNIMRGYRHRARTLKHMVRGGYYGSVGTLHDVVWNLECVVERCIRTWWHPRNATTSCPRFRLMATSTASSFVIDPFSAGTDLRWLLLKRVTQCARLDPFSDDNTIFR